MTDYPAFLRKFLSENCADAILINSSDDFLSEYNTLSNNSRYKVTGFTGSMGDCVVTRDKIFLFVDGRYHQQADYEVNHDFVTVVKLQQGESNLKYIAEVLEDNSVLISTANKISVSYAQKLEKFLSDKNIQINFISNDPIDEAQITEKKSSLIEVPAKITKYSAREKFNRLSLSENQYLIVTYPCDFAYFTNLRNYDFPYSSAPRAKAIFSDKSVTLYTDCPVPYEFPELSVKSLSSFANDLSQIRNSDVCIDKQNMSYSDYLKIDKSNKVSESEIFELKTVKNENEIKHLKDSFKATDRVLFRMNNLINSKDNLTEYDLFLAINKFFEEEGASAQSFKPIIASGANTSVIHYGKPSDKKFIKDGELVMIDCGGYFDGGIATDITRTFIKGTPNQEQKHVYTMVLKAFIRAYTNKKILTWYDIDKSARDVLICEEKNGYLFSHATGHGIGISVHEFPPRCASFDDFKKPFKKNYVFSIEPGLYKTGVGGVRLENAVYIESLSPEIKITSLSHYPFEDKLVDYSLLNDFELDFYKDWQKYGEENNLIV